MNLVEGLLQECNRVRGLIPLYEEIGPAGQFGVLMLKTAIVGAERALASGDVIAMVQALEELRDCKA